MYTYRNAGLNYKDVSDPACVVTFPLVSDPTVALLAWTTTPWTLPSNLGMYWYDILCNDALYYVISSYPMMLNDFMLCYVILFYVMKHYVMLQYDILCKIALYHLHSQCFK